jgi:hypothetical protein
MADEMYMDLIYDLDTSNELQYGKLKRISVCMKKNGHEVIGVIPGKDVFFDSKYLHCSRLMRQNMNVISKMSHTAREEYDEDYRQHYTEYDKKELTLVELQDICHSNISYSTLHVFHLVYDIVFNPETLEVDRGIYLNKLKNEYPNDFEHYQMCEEYIRYFFNQGKKTDHRKWYGDDSPLNFLINEPYDEIYIYETYRKIFDLSNIITAFDYKKDSEDNYHGAESQYIKYKHLVEKYTSPSEYYKHIQSVLEKTREKIMLKYEIKNFPSHLTHIFSEELFQFEKIDFDVLYQKRIQKWEDNLKSSISQDFYLRDRGNVDNLSIDHLQSWNNLVRGMKGPFIQPQRPEFVGLDFDNFEPLSTLKYLFQTKVQEINNFYEYGREDSKVFTFKQHILDTLKEEDEPIYEVIKNLTNFKSHKNIYHNALDILLKNYNRESDNFKNNNFYYLEAVRANTQRIYTWQSQGTAFNQILLDLVKSNKPWQLGFINYWLKEFGIAEELKIKFNEHGIGASVSVDDTPLADLGYGVTQFLPILMKIVTCVEEYELDQKRPNNLNNFLPKILYIEEPETNLHPKLQSKLADMLIDANKKFNLQIIVETHSEYLIRKLQYLTANKSITPETTVIHYFYDPKEVRPEGVPQVKQINIREDGRLSGEFGAGFYDETARLMTAILTGESLN